MLSASWFGQTSDNLKPSDHPGVLLEWRKRWRGEAVTADISGGNRMYSAVLNRLCGGLCLMFFFLVDISDILIYHDMSFFWHRSQQFHHLYWATAASGYRGGRRGTWPNLAHSESIWSLWESWNPIPTEIWTDLVFADFRSIL